MTSYTPPATLAAELRSLTHLELSLPARLRYVALLLAASAMTAIVTALLMTEPALPARTSAALSVMAAMGAAWIVFAAWVLTHKRILVGRQRIVAGRLAVGFSSMFTIGALAVGSVASSATAFAAAGLGAVKLAVAIVLLVRARRTFVALGKRREALERELALQRA